MFIRLTSDVEVNDFITALGANVLDENGNQANLKPTLHALVNLITRKDTFPEKHYDYVGESACTFAIKCILSKTFIEYSTSKLRGLELFFKDLERLADAHFKRLNLDKFVEPGHTKDAFFYLLGILYDSFDSKLVERFIEQTVKDILHNKCPVEEDAVSTLTKFILSKKGNLETKYMKLSTQWRAILFCKLRPNGIVFTYDAIGNSKQKAKAEACQVILKFFKDHPSELGKFENDESVNNEVIQLMIPSTSKSALLEEETKKDGIREQTESLLGCDRVLQPIGPNSNDSNDNNLSYPYQPFPTATPFGPFTAYTSSKKSLDAFRDIFKNDLTKLCESNASHDAKGALLSLFNNKKNVTHNLNLNQTGESHNPIFTVDLEVTLGKYLLRTSGSARKKKDAEIQAYQRFAKLLTSTTSSS